MFVKHVCSSNLKWHCYLDLWPRNHKFNRGHLLVMTNHHNKLEDHWVMSSLVIDRTMFVYWPTERPTYAKQYTPTSSKGEGHNYNNKCKFTTKARHKCYIILILSNKHRYHNKCVVNKIKKRNVLWIRMPDFLFKFPSVRFKTDKLWENFDT